MAITIKSTSTYNNNALQQLYIVSLHEQKEVLCVCELHGYQRRHLSLGFIGEPSLHSNAVANSSLFTRAPITLSGWGEGKEGSEREEKGVIYKGWLEEVGRGEIVCTHIEHWFAMYCTCTHR